VLLAFGAASPVVFAATFTIDAAIQPGYSSWHDTISTLSLAQYGWVQIANFMVYGVLTLCFAEGLRRSAALRVPAYALLVLGGLGLILIGPFRTDPVLGFPPAEPTVVTATGTVHNMGALIVFLAFPIAAVAALRRPFAGWAVLCVSCSMVSLIAIAAFFAAVTAAHGQDGGNSPAGLYERLPILFMGLWQTAYAMRALTGATKAETQLRLRDPLVRKFETRTTRRRPPTRIRPLNRCAPLPNSRTRSSATPESAVTRLRSLRVVERTHRSRRLPDW
jgi:hypothetical membrane protein